MLIVLFFAFSVILARIGIRNMPLPKRFLPYLILCAALLGFVFPIFGNRTLTNFSDTYNLYPWSHHRPDGWFGSHTIDGTPIYLINPSERLNRTLLKEENSFFWNPYVGFGAPWLANMQPAQYFPVKFIAYIWPDYWRGADIVRIVLFLLAGSGNYLLLRSIGVGRNAAIFSGLSFMLCERLFMLVNMASFQVECLLPLMLYAVNETTKYRSIGYALFAGAIGGTQFLGGFPEGSFIFALVALAFFSFGIFTHANIARSIITTLTLGLLIAAIAAAISGFQLIEFIRYLFYSDHVHLPGYGSAVKPTHFLLTLLLPNFFGEPFQPQWLSEVASADHFAYSMFCGISTVLLSMIAAISGRGAPHRTYFWFFSALLTFFIGYDFGLPLFKNVGELPLFNLMSITWNAYVIPLALTVIAGIGFQAVFGYGAVFATFPTKRIGIAIALYAIAVVVLCIHFNAQYFWPIIDHVEPVVFVLPLFLLAIWAAHNPRYFNVGIHLMFALIVSELLFSNSGLKYLHFYSANAVEPPSLKWISENIGHERIFGVNGVYPADSLTPYRIRDIRHLDAMYPKLYVDFADTIWPGARRNVYTLNHSDWRNYTDPLLDIAAVRYVVSESKLVDTESDASHFTEVYKDADVFIYRNERALPRARFVETASKAPVEFTPAALRTRIQGTSTSVVLEGIDADAKPSCPPISSPEIQYVIDNPDHIRLRVSTPCHGFVILADLFYPGWKATVDGVERAIYRANYAFRAVEVPAGDHDITFSYRPWSIQLGLAIMLSTVFGLSFFLIGTLYRSISLHLNSRP